MHKFAMIILAAGLSRRMGVFKPLLPVGGEPAILRCVQTAKAAGVADIIVVTGHCKAELEDILYKNVPDAHVVHNDAYQDGMFSSVQAGIKYLPDDIDGVFLLPTDCCAISSEALVKLMGMFAKGDTVSVIRPKFGEGPRGHPPLIPAQFIDALRSYDGADGLKGFLRALPTVEIEMADPGVCLDMDTPEDYAKLLAHLGFSAYPTVEQSLEILERYNTPPDIIAHGRGVAALALKIANLMMERRATTLDTALLESACLLHDIKRMEPNHAQAGKEFFLKMGYPALAVLIAAHMDLSDAVTQIMEPELLYLSDKLFRQGKVTRLCDTMRELASKFSENPEALHRATVRMKHAQVIFKLLEEDYGITEDTVWGLQSADELRIERGK
ncbi:MAG: NTP transferase domain-containing protein [Oscillospiraceae bacterium]|nr:NTP transferase domain-containing protein [Oscillospiraceae bacterium]